MKKIALSLALAGALAACAHATEPPPGESSLASEACEAQCDCTSCTDGQLDSCKEDFEAVEQLADEKNCDDQLDAYLSCIADDAQCLSGFFDSTPCLAKDNALSVCLGGGEGCAFIADGKCDEPEGSGLCAEGSDVLDCGGEGCASTFDGVCDEPEGTGLCADGTDFPDCSPTGVCMYEYNGECDEPEGTGLCAEGTDFQDGIPVEDCPLTNDGYCDEPEGTGLCPEGTDPYDCSGTGTCATCYEYASGSTDPLCIGSEVLYQAVVDCICATGCPTQCDAACNGGEIDSVCDSCVNSQCSAELTACSNDV